MFLNVVVRFIKLLVRFIKLLVLFIKLLVLFIKLLVLFIKPLTICKHYQTLVTPGAVALTATEPFFFLAVITLSLLRNFVESF